MKNKKTDQVLSGSCVELDSYIPPEITILDVTLEKGFAASSDSTTEDWGSVNW